MTIAFVEDILRKELHFLLQLQHCRSNQSAQNEILYKFMLQEVGNLICPSTAIASQFVVSKSVALNPS